MSILKQFEDAKASYPGMLLLFRCGDWYEAFGDDALELAKHCGATVTLRDDWPMAGFPYTSLEVNLRKLLCAGVRVAICDGEKQTALGEPRGRNAN